MSLSKAVVLLLSGGIDSTVVLADLCARAIPVHALSFDYGQRHGVELEFAKRNARKYGVTVHHIIKPDYKTMQKGNLLTDWSQSSANYQNEPLPEGITDSYVPGRNLLMLSYAAAYAEAQGLTDIYFAVNADDALRFPDCSAEFINALNAVWQTCPNTRDIHLKTPLLTYTKTQVLQKATVLGVPLDETLSCYTPIAEKECGICLSCTVKQNALAQL